jgi:FlaA1/EpsC-like NDP-sugar epimerase
MLFTAALYFVQRAAEDISLGPPRTAIVIEMFLTASLVGFWRFSFRIVEAWGMSPFRLRPGRRVRTIIVGAGSTGDLLLRDLIRSDEHDTRPRFVDDLPTKRGR